MMLDTLLEVVNPGSLKNGGVGVIIYRGNCVLVHGSLHWLVIKQRERRNNIRIVADKSPPGK
jgi:hypothetical protein